MAGRAKSARPVPAESAEPADVVQIPAEAHPPKFVDPYTPLTPASAEVDRIVRKALASGKAGNQSALESVGRTYAAIVPTLLNTVDIGAKAKVKQSERAKKSRSNPINDAITQLVAHHPNESAKELWWRLVAPSRDGYNSDYLEVKEINGVAECKWLPEGTSEYRTRSISFAAFKSRATRAKKKLH